MPTAAIALGANLPSSVGTPAETLTAAVERLSAFGEVLARSSLYRTEPVGYLQQPEFVNAAVLIETSLQPVALLDALLQVEREFGRQRGQGPAKGPRTLDLDLLFYGEMVIATSTLTLPHPSLDQRRFVLEPLAEIAPAWRHPLLGRTIVELLAALPCTAAVTRLKTYARSTAQ